MRKWKRKQIERVRIAATLKPPLSRMYLSVTSSMRRDWEESDRLFSTSTTTQSNDIAPALTTDALTTAMDAMREMKKDTPIHIEAFSIDDLAKKVGPLNEVVVSNFGLLYGLRILESEDVKPGTIKFVYEDGREKVVEL